MRSVLIVGNDGAFLVELVNKFYKEGWLIYLLAEQHIRSSLPSDVEQFIFDYTSTSAVELMESCLPEVVVFTGAHDTHPSWEDENWKENNTSTYIAGLNNILMGANAVDVKQFVYLSSGIVFEEPSSTDIEETAEPTPQSPLGFCMAQGETVVSSFARFSDMEVTIIRIADMFCIPRSEKECVDRYTQMCLSALLKGVVTVNARRVSAPLFVKDAVFALYLIVSAYKRSAGLYHLAATEEANEENIATAIKNTFNKPISIADKTSGLTDRRVLSCERGAKEFGFSARVNYEQAINTIITYMDNHRKDYGADRKANLLNRLRKMRAATGSAFPFIECALFFIPFYLLNSLQDQVYIFSQVDFFLIFVFLFAIMRGRTMAIFAFCLSVVGHYVQLTQSQSFLQLLIDVNSYIWIVQLFVIGIFTGFLRDKLMQSRQEGREGEQYLQKRLDEITAINASNMKIKNYYAERIVNSDQSVGWFYDVITELDNADSGEVVFRAAKLLQRLMGTEHVAIYSMSEKYYCRLVASTSARAMELGKSIRVESYPELFEPLFAKNSFFNQDIVSNLPSMASSLVGSESDTRLIILLWDMPFEKKTLYYSNLLKVVGTLIYNATARSTRYLDALQHQRYVPDTQLLNPSAFAEMMGIYQRVKKMGLAQFCVLEVRFGMGTTKKEMDQKIHEFIRQSDIAGIVRKRTIGILLPNSTDADGEIVKGRLEAAGIRANTLDPENFEIDDTPDDVAAQGNGKPYKETLRDLARQFSDTPPDGHAA